MPDLREPLTPNILVYTIGMVDCGLTLSEKEDPLSEFSVAEYQKYREVT